MVPLRVSHPEAQLPPRPDIATLYVLVSVLPQIETNDLTPNKNNAKDEDSIGTSVSTLQ
jgi:hypothetical protein